MKKFVIWIFLFYSFSLLANPSSPSIKAGKVNFSHPDNNTLKIDVSNKSIINWKQFSINKGEITKFNLPNSKSSVLNRVIGKDISKISGRLESNGKVYLLNKNGIYIDGIVNVASFVASTLNLSDNDFLNNKIHTFIGENNSSITNVGKISTFDGDVFLLAYSVENLGEISSAGTCGIGAGNEILLQPEGIEKIAIKIKNSSLKKKEGIGISQKGKIDAIQVELKADGNPYSYAIKNEGYIDAKGYKKIEGKVFLVGEGGTTFHSGKIIAKNDEKGGKVRILGKKVRLYKEAIIDASGKNSGGEILIGGDYQGKNEKIINSEFTLVEKDVKIFADAHEVGDGGKVIIWGDKVSAFYGNISGKGGGDFRKWRFC